MHRLRDGAEGNMIFLNEKLMGPSFNSIDPDINKK